MLNKQEIIDLHATTRKHLLPFSDPGVLETELIVRKLAQSHEEAIDRIEELERNYLLLVTAIDKINKDVIKTNRRYI